ncbi:ATP-binding cassette domain-containing protein [Nesterenkonia sp. HG001]|uniref:ATP-binding cassette domain-containing protein n=1 Tax=Nesterenkonia sp. HG001 TaxID=2983207 RepID=UPI002AC66253|nr:ATP-binding cassette domain-containing protein [Nesterenkonia sp. HG001]MDZ5077511.1 ATP-binding cassette domain-containing protein [Nesterenkonia sp. HG001]
MTTSARPPGRLAGGAAVEVRGWRYQHADRPAPAVDGLDLHLDRGEKVLLVGASGAGKSTLLHGLAGVLHDEEAVSSGELLIDGLAPEQARGRMGLMQQDPESQVVLSRMGDDVAFAPENLAVPADQIWDRVRQVLVETGLAGSGEQAQALLDHPTARLSGGQKQRLALAGILAMRPALLLLDEPTANLDPDGTRRVRDAVIEASARQGSTLLVVEHRLSTWADHVDTLIVLDTAGGVRHRVPAGRIHDDADLRADLVELGLWVPGHDPVPDLLLDTDAGAQPEGATAGPEALRPRVLLTGRELAVSRERPRRRQSRRPAPVLQGIDVDLPAGRALGITGRNGAGKSTLLLSLAGLIPVHEGELVATGELKGPRGEALTDDPHRWRSADLVARLGMVFQEPEHQLVRPTVREELALGARQARQPGEDAPLFTSEDVEHRVARLLTRLGLAHLAEVNPFTLSGGEKRRLSVGTVLAAGPEVLMLDEPTFGQDAHTFAALIRLLREHLDDGGTVVAVTHDEAFLRALQAEEMPLRPEATGQAAAEDALEEEALEEDDCADGRTPRDGVVDHRASRPRGTAAPMLTGVRSESRLGGANALAKLFAVLLVTAALVSTMDWVSSSVVIVASFLLLPWAGLRLGQFLLRIWPFAIGSVVAVWGTAIAAEESGAVLLDLGFTTVSEGSVELGIAMGARALAVVLPSVIIFSTTDPTDLADSLAQQMRLPARFVLGALAAMRLLGLLAEHWTTIGLARRARGVGTQGGLLGKVRATCSQAFGLLVQAIRVATRLAVTMESRGFGASSGASGPAPARTWARPASFSVVDIPVVLGGALLAVGALAVAVLSGHWNPAW